MNEHARLGCLTRIQPRARSVRLEYEIEEKLPAISTERLKELADELDIERFEFNRTHWAVKDIDLVPVLVEAGIITEEQLAKYDRDSKFVRLALSRSVDELHIAPTVFRVPHDEPESDLVSVMMPFDRRFDAVYESIKSACSESKMRCRRADDIWDEPEVIQDVFRLIYLSRVVICDFSERNANVLYEAGIAHTLGRQVIPITQNPADIPFDLQQFRFLQYLNNGEGRELLRGELAKKLSRTTQS